MYTIGTIYKVKSGLCDIIDIFQLISVKKGKNKKNHIALIFFGET